jgi:hypothetical protein
MRQRPIDGVGVDLGPCKSPGRLQVPANRGPEVLQAPGGGSGCGRPLVQLLHGGLLSWFANGSFARSSALLCSPAIWFLIVDHHHRLMRANVHLIR